MPRENTKLLNEVQARRDDESRAMQALLQHLNHLVDDLQAAEERAESAAELLGECMAVVGPALQDTISETVSSWDSSLQARFTRAEQEARATPTAELRRAS